MQCVENDDAPHPSLAEPVDRMRGVEKTDVPQKSVQGPLLTEDLLDADGSHKRRHDHRNKHQCPEKGFAWKKKPIAYPGKRNGYESRHQRAPHAHLEGVPEPFEVKRIPENLNNVGDREFAIRTYKCAAERLGDGPEKEERKEKGREKEHESRELPAHFTIPSFLASWAASWYWRRNLSASSLARRTSSRRFLEESASLRIVFEDS